jgi:hypothetical protein
VNSRHLEGSTGREIFRYAKSDRRRTYRLRAVTDEATELWVTSEARGRAPRSRRLVRFTTAEDIPPFLESVELELRAGGWGRSG